MSTLTGTYNLDPAHSSVGFTVRHAMVTKVRGEFTDYEASITVAEDPSASTASGTVRTESIDTRNEDRDAHVRGEDFFAVEQYPEMTFNATSFDVDANGNGTVTGDLTIKGTTKPVTFEVETFGVEEDPFGNIRMGFEARTTINRSEFGIDFQAPLNSGGMMLSEKVGIEIEGSAIKQ
ncbi:polyisoprenoid-binding protein [Corynebacterium sp. CCUG 69979]|uniref:YceI family protein n=1 Tax=Corynebacterium sp. CCUG 69979 TaxID=2823890 RepID=UPI00210C4C93|nr:YceI family protein [Corynebacterium sp. CCUG 69979]MCQ4625917.1 polyisoprenoid-binding protein [Corynebacterium sp. CCUG 69979]